MTCKNISALLGIVCQPLKRGGNLSRIGSPFKFDDGDEIGIYVEETKGLVRFFDDGGILAHFMNRGLVFDNGRKARFIRSAADGYGVTFTDGGDLELWAKKSEAPAAFGKFLSALIKVAEWERDQRGLHVDAVLLIDEVAFRLQAWKPGVTLTYGPEYAGVTQQIHKLDLKFDGRGILVTGSNTQAVGSAIRRLVDINAGPQGKEPLLVVMDDRHDPLAAKRESLLIQTVAPVMMFSNLEKNARSGAGAKH